MPTSDFTWIDGIRYRIVSRDLVRYETDNGPISYTVCSVVRDEEE